MLSTVREFALECLEASGGAGAARRAHAAHFLAWVEAASDALRATREPAWLDRLEAERANLRVALRWAAEHEPEWGLRLAGAASRFWEMQGHFSEARESLGLVLAAPRARMPAAPRSAALLHQGHFARMQGDYPVARACYEESLAVRRGLGDLLAVANVLQSLGLLHAEQGDYSTAQALQEESVAIMRELGDPRGLALALINLAVALNEQGDRAAARARYEESLGMMEALRDRRGIALALHNLGNVARWQGDLAAARAFHERSLGIRREIGDQWGLAFSHYNLGGLLRQQGDHATALAMLREGLLTARRLGDPRVSAACLEELAGLAGDSRAPRRAARLFGAGEALREAIGAPVPGSNRPGYERDVTASRTQLDPEAFAAAWAEGRASPLERAVQEALSAPSSPDGALSSPELSQPDSQGAQDGGLTAREREVVALVAAGRTNRQIGAALVIARPTADRHVANILKKLQLHNRAQLAAWATSRGLVAERPD